MKLEDLWVNSKGCFVSKPGFRNAAHLEFQMGKF